MKAFQFRIWRDVGCLDTEDLLSSFDQDDNLFMEVSAVFNF